MKNKKKLKFAITIFSIMLITISLEFFWDLRGTREVLAPFFKKEKQTEYNIKAEFIEDSMSIKAKEKIVYINQENKDLEEIYFHLYPNAFKDKDNIPFEDKELERAYPKGFDPGYIDIVGIKKGNKTLDYKILGKAQTSMRVSPPKPIKPGDKISLTIEFNVQLPHTIARMGYGDNTVNITNWFPIIAVYDDRGWNLDPYYAIGDPFYSEVANYTASVKIPREYNMAITGNVIKTKVKGENKSYEVKAPKVRDFVMILSKKFEIEEEVLGNTRLISYSIGGNKGKEALGYGLDALEIFNSLFDNYPYETLSIVACDFFMGGMEYPNLVMISKDLYDMKEEFPLEYVIVHEIAHQWWYGLVGNNEVREPWLDEALAEYSTLMYFEEKYGPHIKEQIFEKMINAQYENYIKFEPDKGERILRSLREFDNSWQYSSIVYSKGAIFLRQLRDRMGDEAFLKALREYYRRHKFKNATTEDFRKACQNNHDKDLTPLFNEWLKGY